MDLSPTEQPAEMAEALPESVKEETREQFEKLKEHNKQLSEKLAALEAKQQPKFNSVLDEMPVQQLPFDNLSTTQVADITRGLVDANGFIDQDLLNKTLQAANEQARRAEDRALLAERRIEKFEETQVVRDVHAKHPALDPYSSSFNQEFYNRVRDEVTGQLKKGYRDFAAAADKIAAELKAKTTDETKVNQQKEVEQKKVLAQREQATVSSGGRAISNVSHEDMEDGVRKGDNLSIGQLLQASGY